MRQSCYMPSHKNFASLKGLPKLKKTNRLLFWCFTGRGGGVDHPTDFLGFHPGDRFKIGKMYEALTTMVFNRLL